MSASRRQRVRRADADAEPGSAGGAAASATTASIRRPSARRRGRRCSPAATTTPSASGLLVDLAAGYPGYDGRFRPSAATIAAGPARSTATTPPCFGKHHNVPGWRSAAPAGPFDRLADRAWASTTTTASWAATATNGARLFRDTSRSTTASTSRATTARQAAWPTTRSAGCTTRRPRRPTSRS